MEPVDSPVSVPVPVGAPSESPAVVPPSSVVSPGAVLVIPDVPSPVAVRYAYSSNPTGANLYNRAGLPASPFRTDTW